MYPLLVLVVWTSFMSQVRCSDISNFLSQLPTCVESCIVDFVSSTSYTTNTTDLCTDPKLKEEFLPCVTSHCLPGDCLAIMNLTSVACNLPIRDKHEQFIILTITLSTMTVIIVGLRFLHQLQYGPGLQLDDYVMMVAFVVGGSASLVGLRGLSEKGLGRDVWTLSPDTITAFLTFLYIAQVLYVIVGFTTKICVLFFYLRIFPAPTIRRLIWGTVGLSVLCMTVFTTLAIVQCQPVSYFWNGWDRLHTGQCINPNAIVWAPSISGIILDFWMIGLPFSQLIGLQMKWKRKLAVATMLGVGTFVTVVSIIRLRCLVRFGNSPNPTWYSYDICYWSAIELSVGVWCACMPSIRLLVTKAIPALQSSVNATPRSQQCNPSAGGRSIKISSNKPATCHNAMYGLRPDHGRELNRSTSTVELFEMAGFANETRSSLA